MRTGRDLARSDLGSFIDGFIRDYLALPENNHLGPGSEGKAWVDVLVGFSSGADPLYQDLKEHVGPFHWTPLRRSPSRSRPGDRWRRRR